MEDLKLAVQLVSKSLSFLVTTGATWFILFAHFFFSQISVTALVANPSFTRQFISSKLI